LKGNGLDLNWGFGGIRTGLKSSYLARAILDASALRAVRDAAREAFRAVLDASREKKVYACADSTRLSG
jgi:hypothetical protein